MKQKTAISATLALLLMLIVTSTVGAQYSGKSWVTVYQVANMGTAPADITVAYYNAAGTEQTTARRTFLDVAVGASVNVNQFSEGNLASGQYSAVVSADQPVAAIVNQQLVTTGAATYVPEPPFGSYSGEAAGSFNVSIPVIMYNWYGYYTEMFVMNVGSAAASNVDISYYPGSDSNGVLQGASGITELDQAIPQFATLTKSQQGMTQLGATTGTYAGRFIGGAKITSDQPIIAIVNQHTPGVYKLMSSNGFGAASTEWYAPSYLRGFYNYYSTLIINNPSDSQTANVTITYTPGNPAQQLPVNTTTPIVVQHAVAPLKSLNRYDGYTSAGVPVTGNGTDLDNGPVYTRFNGSVKVTSDIPVVVQVNYEARNPGPGQAASYNGIPASQATTSIVVPVVMSNYYTYYTVIVLKNISNTAGTCSFAYTSLPGSTVPNASKTYSGIALAANSNIDVYEGPSVVVTPKGHINTDAFWGTPRRFIGSAVITCDVNVVAIVNEESDIANKDSMYIFNAFNK